MTLLAPRRKARSALMVCHAAGLGVSEAIALRPIDSTRMTLRVTQGRGAADCDGMLFEQLLGMRRDGYRFRQARRVVVPGPQPRMAVITRKKRHLASGGSAPGQWSRQRWDCRGAMLEEACVSTARTALSMTGRERVP